MAGVREEPSLRAREVIAPVQLHAVRPGRPGRRSLRQQQRALKRSARL